MNSKFKKEDKIKNLLKIAAKVVLKTWQGRNYLLGKVISNE